MIWKESKKECVRRQSQCTHYSKHRGKVQLSSRFEHVGRVLHRQDGVDAGGHHRQEVRQQVDLRLRQVVAEYVRNGRRRVDELRVGGETKNITVQPKVGNLPAYEVQPQNIEGADGTNGRRVWRAIQF